MRTKRESLHRRNVNRKNIETIPKLAVCARWLKLEFDQRARVQERAYGVPGFWRTLT
ncbi:MAG: hypothetical protein ACTSP2_02660 [Alphaproteobacteria bacterium]